MESKIEELENRIKILNHICVTVEKENSKLKKEIEWLNRGIENNICTDFVTCPKCGELTQNGYICWSCGYDW